MSETTEKVLVQADLFRLESIAMAHRELWSLEADVSERLAEAKRTLGNVWVIISGLIGFAVLRFGQQKEDFWMMGLGGVILYFVASQTFRAWAVERDVRHESEEIERRLWDMKYRWLATGATEAQLGALYSLWTIDPEFRSENYQEGWRKIAADVAERLAA